MMELLHECVRVVNLPYTLLFGATFLYWILYLVGVLGSDFLEFMDFDVDVDADLGPGMEPGIDGDFDADIDIGHGGGALAAVLRFVHGGNVPVTIIASSMILSMWVLSILTNYYLKNTNGLIALGLFIPIFICSMLITKTALMPFVPLLKHAFDESGDTVDILGKPCIVCSLEANVKYGMAEVATKGSPIAIHVRTRDNETLKKGDEAVVFGRDRDDDVYLVTKLDVDSTADYEIGTKGT